MPWLLASPGHQQPWYWHCRMNKCIWTLRVLKQEYSRISRSILWLLMPRLLASPGHQQPHYRLWLCRINRFLSSMGMDSNWLSHLRVDKWQKMQIYFIFTFTICLLKKFIMTNGKISLIIDQLTNQQKRRLRSLQYIFHKVQSIYVHQYLFTVENTCFYSIFIMSQKYG